MTQKYYLTNAIPYVNAKPHIGHALEFTQSDVVARYHRLLGEDVTFVCGSDENALKNVQASEKEGLPIQKFVDKYAQVFQETAKKLNISFDVFQKSSDKDKHYIASQKLWELSAKNTDGQGNSDIYKKSYKGLYCVGCEEFKSPEDLNEQGECPEHPGKKLEEVEEENYFFRLSRYQQKLIDLIESDTYEVVPKFRKNEVLSFLKGNLQDFSISRSNQRAKNWGVPVPGDNSQRIYVWFDALNVYQSAVGFGWNEEKYKKWWPADLHVIGKGIIRFHAVYWPAILMSAGLQLPKKLFVHEYFTVNGQKMSKTLGNVIDPIDMINKYGTDALRYYCLAKFSPFSDGDFSEDKLREVYNADLANGLGNLVARLAKLCETDEVTLDKQIAPHLPETANVYGYDTLLQDFQFHVVLENIWRDIKTLEQQINQTEPWKLEKETAKAPVRRFARDLANIAYSLQPFLPETAQKILDQFTAEKIVSQPPLFPRLS